MKLIYNFTSMIFMLASKAIPKKRNRWVFGAWFGNSISDNPRALSEYVLKEHPELELVWVVREPKKYKNMPYRLVKRNSLRGMYYVATARVAVFNQGYFDLCTMNLVGRAYKVQLWHGVPWKKICEDAVPEGGSVSERLCRRLVRLLARCDLYIAPSDSYAKIALSAFAADRSKIMRTGQPRNEALFNEAFCRKARYRLLKKLGLLDKALEDKDRPLKILVYMPTFRDNKEREESFLKGELLGRISLLAEQYNFMVIEKSHYMDSKREEKQSKVQAQRVYLLPEEDAQILLAAADMLITDYSSCFFDFGIRNKPIIHYIYDYDYYKDNDRGLYYEADEVVGGTAAYNREQLFDAIEQNLKDPDLELAKRERLREKYITYESDSSSKKIVRRIFKGI